MKKVFILKFFRWLGFATYITCNILFESKTHFPLEKIIVPKRISHILCLCVSHSVFRKVFQFNTNWCLLLIHFLISILFRDLRYNRIREIPAKAFYGLSHLHTIFLNENQLATIHSGAFEGLPSLKYLFLNKNHISKISSNAFNHLERLESMWVVR